MYNQYTYTKYIYHGIHIFHVENLNFNVYTREEEFD